jgi:regulator of protease activity HflC (stomatin/prohibitin superfamily)
MKELDKRVPLIMVPLFVVVVLVGSSWYTVGQGDRGIVKRFGRVVAVTTPGLHGKMPLIDSVVSMSVRTQKVTLDKMNVYSKDIQGADVLLSANYSIDPSAVERIYTQYGKDVDERVILPQILAKAKDVFGRNNAVEIVQNRNKIAADITKELESRLTATGVIVESVQIENIDFSADYTRSIEERMKAEVAVAQSQQNLEQEKVKANIVRTTAQGEADALVAKARAQAEATKLQGDAEAYAIKAKAEALAQNPLVIEYTKALQWNGQLPQTMLPSGGVPMINLK